MISAERELAVRTGPPRRRTGPRAVVVDDWPLVQLGLRALLEDVGVGVAGTSDRAAEGVRLAGEWEADLLVLGAYADVAPAAAVRKAKALTRVTRVLVLYGRPDRPEILSLLELGVDGLVPRLAARSELQAAVDRVLAGERVVRGAAVAMLADAVPVPGDDVAVVHGPGPLTAQEARILDRLAVGLSNAEIAVELSVSVATVKTHLSNLYGKLEARNRREAVTRGIDLGVVGLGR